jgi:CheY-like chemotaxis protein
LKNLLWIDDDEQLIDSASPVFERHGFRILKAVNTARALTILREACVDGVLLDVRLAGGENGLELLEEISTRHPHLRVAIFTAYPEYEDHVRAEQLGAAVYFEKIEKSIPLNPERQRAFFGALHAVFPDRGHDVIARHGRQRSQLTSAALWVQGSFFLLTFVVILAGLGVLARLVPAWLLPVVLIACALLYTLVAAFALYQGGRGLSQKNFLTLAIEPLHHLRLLKSEPSPSGSTRRGTRKSR